MELKGSFYGVKKFGQYKTYDVIDSVALDNTYNINKITVVKRTKDEVDSVYMYHTFNSTNNNMSGRWYNLSMKYNDIEWKDDKHQIIYIIPEWVVAHSAQLCSAKDSDTEVLKNVPIKINFTEKGFEKIKSAFV